MKRALGILTGLFLVTMLTTGLILYVYLGSFSDRGGKESGSTIQPKEVKSGSPINILLLGVDVGTVGTKSSPKRSDTIMILHYDPKTSEAAIISVPRDTKVTIKGAMEKINAANAFGGSELAIKTVEQLLGININYYVEINYEGFRKIIDTIGGIETVIPYDMNYDDSSQNLHIRFKKGQKVLLDGKKAEEFVRWRKNNDGSGYVDGDLGRIRTQQEFIVKVVEKLKSPAIIPKILPIAKILPDYIDTNMDPMTIISMSTDIPKLNIDSLQKYTLQGEPRMINEISYFEYKPDKNRDIISLLGGKASQGIAEVNKKDIKVQILNGSGIDGAGAKVKEVLEDKGYTVSGVGSISGTKFKLSHIIDKTLKGSNARQIATDLDIEHVEKDQDSLSKVDLLIIIGSDMSSVLN